MKYLIFLVVFYSQSTLAKDFVLNFEASCFQYYGSEVREEIIQRSLNNWNSIPHTPVRFVRGPDIEEEVDSSNVNDYLWDPKHQPPGFNFLFFTGEHRTINPVVCDEDGEALRNLHNTSYDPEKINGFAAKPKPPWYDFFAVYINESHGVIEYPRENWSVYPTDNWMIPGGRLSVNQMVGLLTHEIGHIIKMGHLNVTQEFVNGEYQFVVHPFVNDYPIMFTNAFNTSGELQPEDLEHFYEVQKYFGLSNHGPFSFSAYVKQHGQILRPPVKLESQKHTEIKVKIDIPHAYKGKNVDFLTVAFVGERWFYYQDEMWIPYEGGEIPGDNMTISSYSLTQTIYKGFWGVAGDVQVYFGLRVEGQIFYNHGMPFEINSL